VAGNIHEFDTQPLPDEVPEEKSAERSTEIVHSAQGKPDQITPGDRGVIINFDPWRYRVLDESDKQSRQIKIVPRKEWKRG